MSDATISLISAVASVACAAVAVVSAYLSYRFKKEDGKAELEKELNRQKMELGGNFGIANLLN